MKLAATFLTTALGAASAFTAPDAMSRASTATRTRMAESEPDAGASTATSMAESEPYAGLVALSKGLNPTIGFYDPLNLAGGDFWDEGNDATIGFLRQAEVSFYSISPHFRVLFMATWPSVD